MQRRSRIGFGSMVSCASKKIIKKKILLCCVQIHFFTEKEEIKIVEVACLLRASWCCVDLNGCKTVILTEESHTFSTPHTHTHFTFFALCLLVALPPSLFQLVLFNTFYLFYIIIAIKIMISAHQQCPPPYKFVHHQTNITGKTRILYFLLIMPV